MNKRRLKKLKNKHMVEYLGSVDEKDILFFEVDIAKMRLDEIDHFIRNVRVVLPNKMVFLPKNIVKVNNYGGNKELLIENLKNAIEYLEED